jgi:regulatory protein YycH of two-component signal transduction system YycFG
MVLDSREKTAIIVSHLISLYSEKMGQAKIPTNQSVIDFIMKNIPQEYKSDLSMDLIDDVFNFISTHGTFINPQD